MRRYLALAATLLAAGCGGGNSTVTDQGVTVKPQGASAFFATANVFFGTSAVAVVTDQANVCNQFTGLDPCNASATATFGIQNANALEVVVFPAVKGDFKVATDGGSLSLSAVAAVELVTAQGGMLSTKDSAVSGSVSVDTLDEGKKMSGSYDVIMQSGTHLQGSFDADDCPGLDAVLASDTRVQCSPGSSGLDSCTNSCTCGSKQATASCSGPPDGGMWSCTCTSGSGATTTCTEAPPDFSLDGCQSSGQGGSTCCSFSF